MQTLLLVGCYLPMGLIPAVIPLQFLQSVKPVFRWISIVPLASGLFLLIFSERLIALLGYAFALLPVLVSSTSLFMAVIGVRLVGQAVRDQETVIWLGVATFLSAIPILVFGLLLILTVAATLT